MFLGKHINAIFFTSPRLCILSSQHQTHWLILLFLPCSVLCQLKMPFCFLLWQLCRIMHLNLAQNCKSLYLPDVFWLWLWLPLLVRFAVMSFICSLFVFLCRLNCCGILILLLHCRVRWCPIKLNYGNYYSKHLADARFRKDWINTQGR